MLSPSQSSSASLEQDSSNTLSTSFIAASDTSNSGLISSSDPNITKFNPSKQHASSTPLIGSTYDNYSAVPFTIASISVDQSPLIYINPCYQSTAANHHHQPVQPRPHYNSNDSFCNPKALRSLQNIQTNNSTTSNNSAAPRSVFSTRRTTSYQYFRPFQSFDDESSTAALSPPPHSNSSNCSPSQASTYSSTNRCSYNNAISSCDQPPPIYICDQSVAVVDWLTEISLLQLTKMFQLYSINQSGSRWPNQIRQFRDFVLQIRTKTQNQSIKNKKEVAATNGTECDLYHTPLAVIQASTVDCNPLPRFVHDLMDSITGQADSERMEGIFRKNGVKVRIEEIKDKCAKLSPSEPIRDDLIRDSQVHDLGDSLKRYFREMPECLFTNRLSKMIENIVNELPTGEHFRAVHYCILLLPTENREALMILLRFLKGIARHSAKNKMNCQNLATCWMPSLFHFSQEDKGATEKNGGNNIGRRRLTRRKTIGVPNDRERNAYEAIKELLAQMIDQWECLAVLPSITIERGLENCHDLSLPTKNGLFEFTDALQKNFKQQLFRLKEDFPKWENFQPERVFTDGSQIFTRKINDMIPLKCYRLISTITAPPNSILMAILYGREYWDSNVLGWKRIGPSNMNCDIVQLQYRSADLLANKDKHAFLARRWTFFEQNNDKTCSLIECSVVPRGQQQHSMGHVSVYESKFLIREICPGHSHLTYISRLDFKGKSSQWYDRVYGEMLVNQVRRLKHNLFKYHINNNTRGTNV